MEFPNRKLHTTAAIVLFMVLAVIIAFFLLPQSLRLDESQTLWQTSRSAASVLTYVAEDVHVPLYHELLRAWRIMVGDSVTYARLLSLVFFLISIPALYMLGARAYNRKVALFAAGIFALSPFMNWYASEIRMYTMFALFTILNQYFYIRIMREKDSWLWVGYGVTAFVGVFTHYLFFLVLLSEAVYYFIRRSIFPKGSFVRFVIVAILVCGAFAPWGWYVVHLGQAQNSAPKLAIPTSVDYFNAFSQFVFGFQVDAVNAVILSLWPVAIILMFLALRPYASRSPESEFFLLTIALSSLGMFSVSYIVPIFVSRYLIFTLPAVYLLLSELLFSYSSPIRRTLCIGLAALMFAGLVAEIWNTQTPVKEDYLDVATYLNTHAEPQDVIIISAPFTIYPIQYYYRGPAPLETLPYWNRYAEGPIPNFSASALPAQVQQESTDAQNVWLVLSYNQGYEDTIRNYFQDHYQQLYEKEYSPDLTLYEFKIRYDTYLSQIPTATSSPSS